MGSGCLFGIVQLMLWVGPICMFTHVLRFGLRPVLMNISNLKRPKKRMIAWSKDKKKGALFCVIGRAGLISAF